jgi:hypothetical protein
MHEGYGPSSPAEGPQSHETNPLYLSTVDQSRGPLRRWCCALSSRSGPCRGRGRQARFASGIKRGFVNHQKPALRRAPAVATGYTSVDAAISRNPSLPDIHMSGVRLAQVPSVFPTAVNLRADPQRTPWSRLPLRRRHSQRPLDSRRFPPPRWAYYRKIGRT